MTPGTQLAHYEILEAIGKGGMGEVWRAKDTKLGRDVAIKTLPPEFAQDADRLARFEREAKLLASLNHPNIAAIYGLEEHEGSRFLVLELVEGDTLADRLKRGAIPVEESLKLALQIAEALEAAHEKGVIHRDLKPANIKITPDGKIKVLDFGLAKAFAGEEVDANLSNSPTLSMQATQAGVILGTAAYMSPEQASGKETDRRADIWSFGVVLFEMLAGRQVFDGETVSHVLAAVLAKDPSWDGLPHNLHPRIRFLLERCLEKNAKNRAHDIADVRADIKKALADPNGVTVQPVTESVRAGPQSRLPWLVAVGIVAVVAAFLGWTLRPASEERVVRFAISPPADAPLAVSLNHRDIAISPDGSHLVYVSSGEPYRLQVRPLDQMASVEAADLELIGSGEPFFSPDGSEIGFSIRSSFFGFSLRRAGVRGTPSNTIVPERTDDFLGASWGSDGTIIFGSTNGLLRVPAAGGDPTPLTMVRSDDNVSGHFWPDLLPDTNSVLFTAWTGSAETSEIRLFDLNTETEKILISGGSAAQYVPTGYLLYAAGGRLWATGFDATNLETIGDPAPVLENLNMKGSTGAANFDVSQDGTLVYVPGEGVGAAPTRSLVWLDGDGSEQLLPVRPGSWDSPRLSPDESRVAFWDREAGDVWTADIATGRLTQVTTDSAVDAYPLWTQDGERVVFGSLRGDGGGLYMKNADRTGSADLVALVPGFVPRPLAWSADGDLIFAYGSIQQDQNIGRVSIDASGSWTLLLDTQAAETMGTISPNGELLAYQSQDLRSGTQVYLTQYPELDNLQSVSTAGGRNPEWSPQDDALFYLTAADVPGRLSLRRVAVTDGRPGSEEPLFDIDQARFSAASSFVGVIPNNHYDVSRDGRFLFALTPTSDDGDAVSRPETIHVVLNWFEELQERVPVP